MVRSATAADLEAVRVIYNQGIEDRIATLETDPKSAAEIAEWFAEHIGRYQIVVAESGDDVVGWASLNPYSHRCAHDGIADLSVYVRRDVRGRGIGYQLLTAIARLAADNGFHKIVLFTLPTNVLGQSLYRKCGYSVVGTFKDHGKIDGRFVDVMVMEKQLSGANPAQIHSK